MTPRENRLVISLDPTTLPDETSKDLWGLVVDAAMEQRADEISLEGLASGPGIPPEVEEAQQRLLAGPTVQRRPNRRFQRRWQWRKLSQEGFEWAKMLGPWAVGLNLYRTGSQLAGISDYGTSINLIAPGDLWKKLAARIERELGSLPSHDIVPLRDQPDETSG
jgi:hypothetical protein